MEFMGWLRCQRQAQAFIDARRKEEARKVKDFIAKRPAARMKRPSCAKVHRTAFNLVRSQGLKRAGVHRRPPKEQG
jgi:hypothetical protein